MVHVETRHGRGKDQSRDGYAAHEDRSPLAAHGARPHAHGRARRRRRRRRWRGRHRWWRGGRHPRPRRGRRRRGRVEGFDLHSEVLDGLDGYTKEVREVALGRARQPDPRLLRRMHVAHDDVRSDRDAAAADHQVHVLGLDARLLGEGGLEGVLLGVIEGLQRLGQSELAHQDGRKETAGVQRWGRGGRLGRGGGRWQRRWRRRRR